MMRMMREMKDKGFVYDAISYSYLYLNLLAMWIM